MNGREAPVKGYQNLYISGTLHSAQLAERAIWELIEKEKVEKLMRGSSGYGAHQPMVYQYRAHP